MNPLISIQNQKINDQILKSVNARDLHSFLESKQDFSDWIRNRIKRYDFIEGIDYVDHKIMVGNCVSKIEYFISLDMAKELSMVERNAKGKQARTYFIAMENLAKEKLKSPPPPKPQDLSRKEILKIALEAEERADGLQKEKDTLERVLFKAHDIKATALAGMFGMSAMELNRIMREESYLRKNNIPKIEFIRKGYFSVGYHKINHEDGDISQKPYTKYTGKGAVLALHILKARGILDKGFQLELNLAA